MHRVGLAWLLGTLGLIGCGDSEPRASGCPDRSHEGCAASVCFSELVVALERAEPWASGIHSVTLQADGQPIHCDIDLAGGPRQEAGPPYLGVCDARYWRFEAGASCPQPTCEPEGPLYVRATIAEPMGGPLLAGMPQRIELVLDGPEGLRSTHAIEPTYSCSENCPPCRNARVRLAAGGG